MAVEMLKIDSDDLALDLPPDIERSFGVELPLDLRHVMHRLLAERGARHSPASVWNSLRTLLSGYGIGSRDVDATTRLLT